MTKSWTASILKTHSGAKKSQKNPPPKKWSRAEVLQATYPRSALLRYSPIALFPYCLAVLLSTGLLAYWPAGPPGLLANWSTGLLVYWPTGLLACWASGLLAYWFTGLLAYWSAGLLGYWPADTLASKVLGCTTPPNETACAEQRKRGCVETRCAKSSQ